MLDECEKVLYFLDPLKIQFIFLSLEIYIDEVTYKFICQKSNA